MAETGTRVGVKLFALAVIGVAVLWLGPSAAGASYVHKYVSSFPVEPAGTPTVLAVDEQSGSVYTLTTEGKLEKFDSAGAPSNFTAPGQNWIALKCGEECRGIAVDNSGGVNQGVIYVGSSWFYEPGYNDEEAAVEAILPTGAVAGLVKNSSAPEFRKMCGVGVGPKGELYVAVAYFQPVIDMYQPKDWATNPTQEPPVKASIKPTDHPNPCKTTVDSQGNLYWGQGAAPESANGLFKYGQSAFGSAGKGTGTEEVPTPSIQVSSEVSAASVDIETDDVYADHVSSIERLDSSGAQVETFGEPQVSESRGVAVNGQTKKVYAANYTTNDIAIFSPFTTPDLTAVKAVAGTGSVLFEGDVDPAGAGEVVECEFEYRKKEEAAFQLLPCESPLPYTTATHVTASLPNVPEEVDYEYRLRVGNANAQLKSPVRTFRIAPPAIEGVYAAEVEEANATLVALVDPKNAPAEYFFEYGTTPEYGTTVPVPTGTIAGGANGTQKVTALATGLSGYVTYHFRAVAITALGRVESHDLTFNYYPPECPNAKVRQQTGSDFLPDCRAYELVSPRSQGNAILNPGILTPPSSYATNPARMTFGGVAGGINGTKPVIGLGYDTYLSTRTPTGWVTTLPGLKGNEINGSTGKSGEVADLGLNLVMEFQHDNAGGANPGDPEAAKEGFPYETNLPYIFNADGSFVGRWPALGSTIRHAENIDGYFQPSPDFSHVAFSSANVAFAPNGVIEGPGSAYDYDVAKGTTTIISKTPSGGNIEQQESIHSYFPEEDRVDFEGRPCQGRWSYMCEERIFFPGIGNGTLQRSQSDTKNPAKVNPGVSTDGSHILMSTASEPYDGFAYNWPRVHLFMRVNDAVTYDVSKGDRVDYVGMTADGSKVFFRSAEQLTADDHDTSDDLFMWSEATDGLTRLSAGAGGSGDTDSCNPTWTSQCDVVPVIYNGGALPDSAIGSTSGEIYFYSPEQLDGSKGVQDGRNIYVYRNGGLQYVTTATITRMDLSPDGAHAAFITSDRITAYDNREFNEMYSYQPASNDLICVSCNPNGSAPVGNVEGALNGLFMANDGRAFFYTHDALVPKDTNKLFDVYEYVDGRPQLITTGVGQHDRTLNFDGDVRSRAALTSVSADGVNVYFDTYENLVTQDENGEFLKYYDARSGGGFPTDAPLQPCVAADECHGVGSSPPPPTGIVSDGSLKGSGNVVGTGARAKGKKRKPHRKRGHGHHRQRRGK